MTAQQRVRVYLRNCGKCWVDHYLSLPEYHQGMTVRCPTRNADGSEIADEDLPGCGSARVSYDGSECYDCPECGIFFTPQSADPPHRRGEGDEEESEDG